MFSGRRRTASIFLLVLGISVGSASLSALGADSTDSNQGQKVIALPTALPQYTKLEQSEIDAAKRLPAALKLQAEVKNVIDSAAMAKFPVPVLISSKIRKNLQVHLLEQHYMATADDSDIEIMISGTRMAVQNATMPPPELLPTRLLEDAKRWALKNGRPVSHLDWLKRVTIVRTDSGVEVSFPRFGAIYDLNIECENSNDPRCTEDLAALEIAIDMELVGGAWEPR